MAESEDLLNLYMGKIWNHIVGSNPTSSVNQNLEMSNENNELINLLIRLTILCLLIHRAGGLKALWEMWELDESKNTYWETEYGRYKKKGGTESFEDFVKKSQNRMMSENSDNWPFSNRKKPKIDQSLFDDFDENDC